MNVAQFLASLNGGQGLSNGNSGGAASMNPVDIQGAIQSGYEGKVASSNANKQAAGSAATAAATIAAAAMMS